MLITFKTLQLQSFKIEVDEDDLVCVLRLKLIFYFKLELWLNFLFSCPCVQGNSGRKGKSYKEVLKQ